MRNATLAVLTVAFSVGPLQGCKRNDERAGKAVVAALPDPNVERFKISVGDAPIRGPEHAKVTIVEWGDFDCKHTAAAEQVVAQVVRHYGDQVRVVWKNLPLPVHHAASPAAAIAMTIYAKRGNAAFWKLHDTLLRNYRPPDREEREREGERREAEHDHDDEEEAEYDRAALERYATEAGLDDSDIELDGKSREPRVDADTKQAHAIGVFGTPTFFINGRPVAGAQPFDAFQKVIDRRGRVSDQDDEEWRRCRARV